MYMALLAMVLLGIVRKPELVFYFGQYEEKRSITLIHSAHGTITMAISYIK